MGLGLFSCEKWIPEAENELELIDTREDCILTLQGAYGKLARALSYHNLFTVKSDDINLRDISNFSCTKKYPLPLETVDNFYRDMYTSIIICNRLIFDLTGYERAPGLDQFLGEAYFLRAYNYFKLVRIFGRIPLVLDIDVNYDTKLAGYLTIYESIISDLNNAVNYLPETASSSRIRGITPNQGVVKALQAEVYLTMAGYPLNETGYYSMAAEKAREVIENADFYGFGLADDFAELWDWETHDSPESILRYYKEPGKEFPNVPLYRENWWTYLPASETHYYKQFPANYRKEITLTTRFNKVIRYTVDSTEYKELVMMNVNPDDVCEFLKTCFGKKQTFNFETDLIRSNLPFLHLYNFRSRFELWDYAYRQNIPFSTYFHVLRYAQTMLTYAEASARSGNPDDMTYETLNMVRRRSYKQPVKVPSEHDILPGSLSPGELADTVVAERKWELCHEIEGRWFDIIRLDLLDEIASVRNPKEMEFGGMDDLFEGNKYFVPLPKTDIWLNPNLADTIN